MATKKENLALIPAHPYYILLYSNLVYSEASLDILPHTPRKNYRPLKSDLYSTFTSFCLVLLSFKQNVLHELCNGRTLSVFCVREHKAQNWHQ